MDRSYTFSFVSKIMNYRNSFQADVRYKHIFLQLVLAHCHIYIHIIFIYIVSTEPRAVLVPAMFYCMSAEPASCFELTSVFYMCYSLIFFS